MNKSKIHKDKFINFIYLSLSIFILESAIFFAKSFIEPRITMAENIEPQINIALSHETRTFELPILIYHYIEYVKDERDTIRKSLNIEPHVFETQIKTLREAGYTFVTPNQLEKIEDGKYKVQKPAIISFDDGYRDFYTDVLPILKKYNVKAVVYVCPGLLDKPNYLYWDQVKEIASSGLVEIGSHSMSHRSLDSLEKKHAEWEIVESKKVLEEKLGLVVHSFAYPYGHYNNQTTELVKSAGYKTALTTDKGINENIDQKFTLKRVHPGLNTNIALLNLI